MTTLEYYDRLKEHDWYYVFSDDRKAYEKGSAEERELIKTTAGSLEKLELFKRFKQHYFPKDWDNVPALPSREDYK